MKQQILILKKVKIFLVKDICCCWFYSLVFNFRFYLL